MKRSLLLVNFFREAAIFAVIPLKARNNYG
jgi:hypothetical protein